MSLKAALVVAQDYKFENEKKLERSKFTRPV